MKLFSCLKLIFLIKKRLKTETSSCLSFIFFKVNAPKEGKTYRKKLSSISKIENSYGLEYRQRLLDSYDYEMKIDVTKLKLDEIDHH